MKNELKIVASPPSSIKIYVGDRQIGLVQDIKFHATASKRWPDVEVVFPNLFDEPHLQNSELLESLRDYMGLLSEIPFVIVTLKDLEVS